MLLKTGDYRKKKRNFSVLRMTSPNSPPLAADALADLTP